MSRNALPKLNSVWVDATGDYPGRRIKILSFLPVDAPKPVGVEARVLTSVHPDRRVMMALRDLYDSYKEA